MSEFEHRLNMLIEKLRQQGHRLTPQRRAVLNILLESHGHLDIEQIYARLRQDFPMTSLATVYKTVALLKEMGVIHQVNLDDGRARYDGSPSSHPHLICTVCRRIVDLDLDLNPMLDLAQTAARREGYQMIDYRFDIFGLCPLCRKNANEQTNGN